jgi:hypothetical protein
MADGIEPVKVLLSRLKLERYKIFPIAVGRSPKRLFDERVKVLRKEILPILIGKVPTNPTPDKSMSTTYAIPLLQVTPLQKHLSVEAEAQFHPEGDT